MANKQYVYIDDSGDPGFKFRQGSSLKLVLLAIAIDNPEVALEISDKMRALRCSFGWNATTEFKYSKSREQIKELFYSKVRCSKCRISVVIIKKVDFKRLKADQLFNYTVLQLIKCCGADSPMKIYIDGEKGRGYRRAVKTYLRQNLPPGVVRSLNYQDSKKNDMLQLADMLVGAVADERKDVVKLYDINIVQL